jgi:hypothetical protein
VYLAFSDAEIDAGKRFNARKGLRYVLHRKRNGFGQFHHSRFIHTLLASAPLKAPDPRAYFLTFL